MKPLLLIILCFVLTSSFGQTDITMKEYVDKQVELIVKLADVRYDNIEKNVHTATAALEKRLDGVNEFRAQLKDQVATFPTRKELWGYIVAVAGLLFGYSNYKRNQEAAAASKSSGAVIRSGDNVEVKK